MDECAALRDMTTVRSHKEACACISADLLNDAAEHSTCLEFCNKWLPVLGMDEYKEWMQRTRAGVICDQFMIGKESNGKRVLIKDVVEFFQSKVEAIKEPRSEDLLYWARIKDWLGETEQALEVIAKIEKTSPSWWKPHAIKARWLSRLGQTEAAFQEIQVSINLAPHRPEPLDHLEALYLTVGKPQEAEAAKTRADEVFTWRQKLCAGN